MAAYQVLLLNTAVPQIQAAQSGDTYVVPRDIAFSAALTLSAGTANGVPYLDGSKVLTTGSGLTFDGTTLTVNANIFLGTTQRYIYQTGTANLNFQTNTGDVVWLRNNGSSEAMRLDSTGLGIGTSSPAFKLDVQASGNSIGSFRSTGANYGGVEARNSSRSYSLLVRPDTSNAFVIRDETASANRVTLDSSGNLGLGVTPSAWSSIGSTLQVNTGGSFSADTANAYFAANCYYNGTNWIYQTTNNATRYTMANYSHLWYTAASGTAGNAISFTQAMTLDADGDLGIGETSPAEALDIKRSGATSAAIVLNQTGTSGRKYIIGSTGSGYGSAGNLIFYDSTASAERARITSGGNFQVSSGGSVQVGGTAARATTAGTNRLDIFDGTAPVGTLANGISIYSSSGEAYVMDAAGNATLFSPHDAVTNEWIFRSKHTPTGKVLKIDVERLLKFVNDHFGLDAVHEFIED